MNRLISLLLLCTTTLSGWSQKFEKDLVYTNYTLDDEYNYKKENRSFQWDKIDSTLRVLDTFHHNNGTYAYLQNYKNRKGNAPLVRGAKKNRHGNYVDQYNVERYQSAPLYQLIDSVYTLVRYGKDGSVAAILGENEDYYHLRVMDLPGHTWYVPKRYVDTIDSIPFHKAIFIDRKNQNIATMEREDGKWKVKSMNPATTGKNQPPYRKATPRGSFVIMQKKTHMYYLKDGTRVIGGFAPYASRFCCGGYIHGIPVNLPRKQMIEYSPSLGTTPRSHMCVRNATSHAKYIFDWVDGHDTLVFVIE